MNQHSRAAGAVPTRMVFPVFCEGCSRPIRPFALARPPVRLDPRSPHHALAVLQQQADIGIRFNGRERFDVEEYCVSEGWIKAPAGRTCTAKACPLLLTLKGTVEAFYKPGRARRQPTRPTRVRAGASLPQRGCALGLWLGRGRHRRRQSAPQTDWRPRRGTGHLGCTPQR